MTPKVKTEIYKRAAKISAGKFTKDDVRLLFLDVRDSLDRGKGSGKDTELLFDIFHFCSHPNARDRGQVFSLARKKVSETVRKLQKNFSFTLQSNPAEIQIVDDLINMLTELGVNHDPRKLRFQSRKIAYCVYQLLHDVKITYENDSIEYVAIEYDKTLDCPVIKFKMHPFKSVTFARDDKGNKIFGEDGKPVTSTIQGEPTFVYRLM